MDFNTIKKEVKDVLVGYRLTFFMVIFVYIIITGALSYLYIGFLLTPILMAGLFLVCKVLIKERKVDFNLLFNYFKDLNHALKIFGVYFIYLLIVTAGLILLIVPGIIFSLQYSQALYIISENPEMGIWEAMEKSKKMMDGHKWEYFVFLLSFIGHYLLIAITFGLYGIYALPYIQASIINYYLHLSTEA